MTRRKPTTRAVAEVAKFTAEAALAAAQRTLVFSEIRRIDAEAKMAEEELAAHLATDGSHCIYRLVGEINSDSVTDCQQHLAEWHRRYPGRELEVVFSSPGGYLFDGMALFDYLRQLSGAGHRIVTGSEGWSASMAGILLQAGDHRWIGAQSWLMLHEGSLFIDGYAPVFRVGDEYRFNERAQERILRIFAARSKGRVTIEFLREQMHRTDWYLEPVEALGLGLVDEIRGLLPEPGRP